MFAFQLLAQGATPPGGVTPALFVGSFRFIGGHGTGLAFVVQRHHREVAAIGMTHRAAARVLREMPTSIELRPVRFTEAMKLTSSPTWIGCRNVT